MVSDADARKENNDAYRYIWDPSIKTFHSSTIRVWVHIHIHPDTEYPKNVGGKTIKTSPKSTE